MNSSIIPTQYTAVFEDKQVYNNKFTHYSFELLKPHRLVFKAGQYLSLAIDQLGNRRAYSIINPPSIDHGVELLVEPVAGGLGTAFLQNLQFGAKVEFLAPLGMFFVSEMPIGQNDGSTSIQAQSLNLENSTQLASNTEQNLVFVATGSGIAPIRSMLLDLLIDRQDQRPITLYWGLRHTSDLIWQDEFWRLSQQFKNFAFYPVISQPSAEWTLSSGRVTDLLQIHQFKENTGFYICGGKQMVDDVLALLIAKGVAENYLHRENFDL